MFAETYLPEVSTAYLREIYADLRVMSDEELALHYKTFGRLEGRVASPHAMREEFLKALLGMETVLEIGPFSSPAMYGDHVKYVDIMSTEEIRAATIERGGDIATVPNIHFDRGLDSVTGTYSAIVSSHNVEHYPDLVGHFKSIERLIKPSGVYALIIPDKRFCFDQPFGETNVAEVIEAHVQQKEKHSLRHVLEHHALTGHNDSVAHWAGSHGHVDASTRAARLKQAWDNFNQTSESKYIDVHAWKFTPASFREITEILYMMGLIGLRPVRVYDTPAGRLEFCAVLQPSSSPD